MIITEEDSLQLEQILQKEMLEGKTWMAYDITSAFLTKESLYCFSKEDEAQQFCADNFSDRDGFNAVLIQPVYDAIIRTITFYNNEAQQLLPLEITIEPFLLTINSLITKKQFMNQKNFDYLKDQVKFTGFGEGLENGLKEKMQRQTPEFQITHNTKFGNEELATSLHFKKSDQTGIYFFNRYQVSFMPEQSKDKMEQTFYINKEGSITLKEAYNLMNGRSINKDLTTKEGQMYNAWMQMDFKQADNNGNYKLKQFHQNYGYDLVSALGKASNQGVNQRTG